MELQPVSTHDTYFDKFKLAKDNNWPIQIHLKSSVRLIGYVNDYNDDVVIIHKIGADGERMESQGNHPVEEINVRIDAIASYGILTKRIAVEQLQKFKNGNKRRHHNE